MEECFAAEKDLTGADDAGTSVRVGTMTIYRWCGEVSLLCLKIDGTWHLGSVRRPAPLPEIAEKKPTQMSGPRRGRETNRGS